ncbi:ABC transporter ATP-binding protein/permease [Microvirga mediterraneensis]|uniref:ABC transporter ATP-binding protein/permease n=1 Tax=Microvirga mediterraneensis TaxID=2754695 RepID=A0A838BH81_9HYPH|nr:ABC transporter ATP-binding protein/permease [Microvirga mediterraneensis]MBA1154900.1 ABC transporter ATP-binding protein/permease [Microvirga mediterraneensis]
MPDFDPKLGKQLPPPPAVGSEQEVGPGQSSTLAKEAATAASHHPETPHSPEMTPSILRELFQLFRDMLRKGKGWPMLRLGAAILVILVGNMFGQVRLNQWNGAFFDAVEKRDTSAFFHQLLVFVVIVGVLLALVVAQTWLQERLKIRLRQRLTQVLLDIWLKPNRAYQMGFMGENGAQPDQRMQEDCRLFSELSTELGVGMLQAFLLLVSFIGVLWALSGPVSFTLGGREITISGYMVWVAVGYAGIGSGLTWLVGRPMIRLNTLRYAREAELRFALVRVNESAESVALYNGEPDERRNLDEFVEAVLKASRRLSGGLARLTWITSGYGWLAIVVPILAAAPDYFAGRLSFGEMMMVVGAFNQVQSALRYFVDNFPKIADWRSAVLRVATFRQAAIDLDEVAAESSKIETGPHPKGWLSFEGVSIALNDGSILIEDATAEIQPGERVLIMGESGAGKSTLFRAISGLWPWGSGRIRIPKAEEMMFLPQRPYLPLGTLRAAISYPASPETFDDADVREALERCGLGEFVDMLDKPERWDRSLSLGQQQRVAFARVLLHRPKWVFMDEATSALDEENQASMLALFENELKGASVLSIGHRPGLEEFHTRTLHIRKTKEGAILLARPRSRQKGDTSSKLGPKWIGRFRRRLKPDRSRA